MQPQGTTIAGKPYREITANELGILGAAVGAGATLSLQPVPWWAGGYGKARITFSFNLAAAGNVAVGVIASDTENSFSVNDPIMDGNGGGYAFPGGGSAMEFNFDDGILPGNWRPIAVIPQAPRGMPLNPTWTKAALLYFQISNLTAAPLTVNAFTVQLGGK